MNWKKAFAFIAIGAAILMADAILKAYIHYTFPTVGASSPIYPYGGVGVFRDWHGIDFSIVHVINRGAAWGFLATMQEVLFYVRMAIIGGLLSYLFFVKSTPFKKFCLMLVAAGAVGNVADYFIYGHVVDMFYFIFWGYSYPVFNIADSAIFSGIFLLVLQSMWSKVRKSSPSKSQSRA